MDKQTKKTVGIGSNQAALSYYYMKQFNFNSMERSQA